MSKLLAIDLFCGLGGWAEGFIAEGFDVIGFDIERHDYGTGGYPGQLVLQDVLTLDGRQFKDTACIVASPPCQAYSYMAMPWSRAKKMAAELRESIAGQLALNCLFNACFRIAHEAGVPLIVENVRGAQPWVGRAKYNYGPQYLWGDVPAIMPHAGNHKKGMNCGRASDGSGQYGGPNDPRRFNSQSLARKRSTAISAKIPFELARWIARCYYPHGLKWKLTV